MTEAPAEIHNHHQLNIDDAPDDKSQDKPVLQVEEIKEEEISTGDTDNLNQGRGENDSNYNEGQSEMGSEDCEEDEEESKKSLDGLDSQQGYNDGDKFDDVKSCDSSFEMHRILIPKNEQPLTSELNIGSLRDGTAIIFVPF